MAPAESPFPDRSRQGAAAMFVLSKPLTYLILDVLAAGACPQSDLHEAVAAARATCFRHLHELEELGVLTRWRRVGSRNAYCRLTEPAGEELFRLASLLPEMFSSAEQLPSGAAEVSVRVRGLAAGWNTTALRWLAEGPCSVRDLDTQAPPGIGLPEVEAAREAMLAAGLIAGCGDERPRRFKLTRLGDGLARPAAASLRWQRRNLAGRGLPLAAGDAETLLMLAGRRLALPDETVGECDLVVEGIAGVHLAIDRGTITSMSSNVDDALGPQVRGPFDAWLAALVEGDVSGLSSAADAQVERYLIDTVNSLGN